MKLSLDNLKEYSKNNKAKVVVTAVSTAVFIFIFITIFVVSKWHINMLNSLKENILFFQEIGQGPIELIEADIVNSTRLIVFFIVSSVLAMAIIVILNIFMHKQILIPIPEQVASAKQAKKERKKAALQAKLDALNSEDKKE